MVLWTQRWDLGPRILKSSNGRLEHEVHVLQGHLDWYALFESHDGNKVEVVLRTGQ